MDTRVLAEELRIFAAERQWEQFHTPRNLLLALMGELGELAELFQWRTDDEIESLVAEASRRDVEREVADIAIYLVRLADVLGIDLEAAVNAKLAENAMKYPASRVKGSSAKYSEY